jgi:hypothetical protein
MVIAPGDQPAKDARSGVACQAGNAGCVPQTSLTSLRGLQSLTVGTYQYLGKVIVDKHFPPNSD